MKIQVTSAKKLSGIIGIDGNHPLPGDKSLSHRAALLSSLALGISEIENFLDSGVTKVMLNILRDLGIKWELNGSKLSICGNGLYGFIKPAEALDCGNSATTMRLITGAIAASGIPAVVDGSTGLRKRPMDRIIDPLKKMGVEISSNDGGRAPLLVEERKNNKKLRAVEYTQPVASAQVKSCLILAALDADGESILREPGPSRDHTERMLRDMGALIRVPEIISAEGEREVYVKPLVNPLKPLRMVIPGDISSAAFLMVAGSISANAGIIIQNVGLNATRTGIIDALSRMGANIRLDHLCEQGGELRGDVIVGSSDLNGIEVSGSLVVRMIDEFPVFAIAAAYANGKTIVRDAEELRTKESDRISMICQELKSLGVEISETQDGFIINGKGKVNGGIVKPHGDHRLAMSLAVAGLASKEPVTVLDAEIIQESFPNFSKT